MKSVLITGCSDGGIGSAIAVAFQKRGLHVFATARSLAKMSNLSKLDNVTLLALDVTDPNSIAAAVERIAVPTQGKLDYLFNNSGLGYNMPTLDANLGVGKDLFDVNFWGLIAMTKAFAPLVIAAKGTIINNSSIAGVCYPPWSSIYAASKAAVTSLSESLRLELAPMGVKVITLQTGAVDTNFYVTASDVKLPATSYYRAVENIIATQAKGEGNKKVPANAYASQVVNDVLNGASGKLWRGGMAAAAKFAYTYLPTSFLDNRVRKTHGLIEFEQSLKHVK